MAKLEWKSCLKIGLTVLAVFLYIHYWQGGVSFLAAVAGGLASLAVGGVIAYIVNILMGFLERHYFRRSRGKNHKRRASWAAILADKSRRPVCMVAAYLIVLVALILVVALVVPELTRCVGIFVEKAPGALETLAQNEMAEEYLPQVYEALGTVDWEAMISQVQEFVKVGIGGAVGNITSAVSGVGSALMNIVLGIVFSIYLLTGKEKLQAQGKELMSHYLKPGWKEKILYVLSVLDKNFHNYIVGKCIEALILGVLCALGMLILGIPYAVMVSVLIGVLSFLPVVGAIIGGVIGVLMVLTVSPVKAIVFLIFILVLQQVESNLIYPKVVGNAIGLPGLWVLASVTLGGGIGGAVGMLIAVPIMAAIYQIVRDDVRRRRVEMAA